jgi:hypothetical protein
VELLGLYTTPRTDMSSIDDFVHVFL